MKLDPYRNLAERLNRMPNGFPPDPEEREIKILQMLFSPEEAELVSHLKITSEPVDQIQKRLGGDRRTIRNMLKDLAKRQLINVHKMEKQLGYSLMPFVVGFFETRLSTIDAEFARLFEDYYLNTLGKHLELEPQHHRVIPVQESIPVEMEIRPYESVVEILENAQAWGVQDCICRIQKKLIGEGCDHPVETCLLMDSRPGIFDHVDYIRSLTKDQAYETLTGAANAGLVHTVSNTQEGTWYICNCCTCSCGILRGLKDLGMSNVVARSEFVNQVDAELCQGCETCVKFCQFGALSIEDDFHVHVDMIRCVGCGICVPQCPEGALSLTTRPRDQIKPPPLTHSEWAVERARTRFLDISDLIS